MKIRIHPHVADWAGSGLVMIGLLLAAMALSAVPVLLQVVGRPPHAERPTASQVIGPSAGQESS